LKFEDGHYFGLAREWRLGGTLSTPLSWATENKKNGDTKKREAGLQTKVLF
jgi:hypothetical protein